MNDFWNNPGEYADPSIGAPVYAVPPNVRFVESGQPQDSHPRSQPSPPQQPPRQVQQAGVAQSVEQLRQRFNMPNQGLPAIPTPKADRPLWFYLIMVGVPCATVLGSVLAVVIGMNSGGAVQRSSMEGMTAVAIESARQRGDVTCISWSCDKFGEALAAQGDRYVRGGQMDVQWGDVKASMSQGAGGQPQMAIAPGQPSQFLTAAGQDANGTALNIWQGDKVVNSIPNGDKLRAISESGEWIQVEWIGAGGLTGWVQRSGVK